MRTWRPRQTAVMMIPLALLFLLGATTLAYGHAGGDECAALGGAIVGSECRITTPVTASSAAHGGAFSIAETLRITGTGSITVPAAAGGNTLTLDIAGDLIIDVPTTTGRGRISGDVASAAGKGAAIDIRTAGSVLLRGSGSTGARISSDQSGGSCAGGRGGNITVTAGGDLTTENGSVVSSTGLCPAGEIILVAGGASTIGGLVTSEGTSTVGRGGPVTVKAACTLTIGDTGRVISRGKDPGADLVHVEGACSVVINGLVLSGGPGHQNPPQNHCSAPERPDKPDTSPACVEVWSGGPLTITSTPPHNGEINVDTAQSGGVLCCGWVDLIARDAIQINGDTAAPFSVHANQTLSNGFGGYVTVISTEGKVTMSGLAVQADANVGGGRAGKVTVQASGAVKLDEAQIFSRGDFNGSNAGLGFGVGGTVSAQAFNGPLTWLNPGGGVVATGDVRPTGSFVPAAQRGTISLTGCGGVTTTGAVFPSNGTATTPTSASACGGAPTIASYVTLPACLCGAVDADVSVALTTSTPVVNLGDQAKYHVVVTGHGPEDSPNVKLTKTLPPGMTWTVSGPDAGACVIASGTLTCSFGTVAASSTKQVTVTATTTPASCSGIAATANVTADADSDPTNNSAGPVGISVVCADPRVTMTTSTPTVNAGGNAIYTITTTAGGVGSSSNVVLTDNLPAGLNWAVSGSGAAQCSIAGGVLTCNFGTMTQGSTKVVTLTAATSAASCGPMSNTATITAAADVNTANNSAGPVTIQVNCPDVGVTKTASAPTVTAGSPVSYTITATASGTGNSTNVVVKDTLPTGLTWSVSGSGCSIAAGVLTCNFGTMTPGSSRTATVTATTSAALCAAGSISNTATVTAALDADASNNSAGPVTVAILCPDVSVTKTPTTPAITAGGVAGYNITVSAGGSGDSANVVLQDTLPAGLTWAVGGADAAACSIVGTALTCNFGAMPAGTTKSITVTATTSTALCAAGGGGGNVTLSNTASVSATVDTNSSNNTTPPAIITVNCPDVSVVLTTSTPTVPAGGTASYEIVTTAGGAGSSTNVVLTDTLPAGLTWTVGGADAAACSISGGVLTCNFGTMAQGSTKNIVLTAATSAANCGSIADTASVSAAVDANLANNSSGPVSIAIVCPDVSVVKTTTTPVIVAGMPVSYTVTVTAGGTGPSTNVVLSDPLPSGLSWTVGGADAASCSPASPVAGGTTLTCNFGTMAAGSSKTITLTAISSVANCPSITNTASVTSSADTGPGNNTSSPVTITINASGANSRAFGESITLNVLPILGTGINVSNGPLPLVEGSAPPAYDLSDSVASAGLSTLLTGQILGTGLIVTNASSDLLAGNNVAADATVNNLSLDVGLALLKLLQVDATVIQSTARISGACGALTATGTSTLAGLSISVLGLGPITIPLNPPANFVLLDALGIRIVLNEQIATGDGVTRKGLTVNAIHITLNNAGFGGGLLGGVINGNIIIASSQAEHDCLTGGQCACELPPPAESSAFGETVNLNLLPGLGQGLLIHSGKVPAVAGGAPPAYNKTASVTSANVSTGLTGSILNTGVVTVHAAANAAGTGASADATVNGLNLDVVGLLQVLSLDSTLVQSTADVSGDCGAFTPTGTTTLANAVANVLGIGSLSITANPLPNTVLLDSQLLGIKIVLNEQIVTGDGVNTRGLTVNAIHIYLVDVDVAGIGIVSGDIIIAQSKAQRNCGGSCQ
jgi:uncharacterized repeat protein (TIGR01451 family)